MTCDGRWRAVALLQTEDARLDEDLRAGEAAEPIPIADVHRAVHLARGAQAAAPHHEEVAQPAGQLLGVANVALHAHVVPQAGHGARPAAPHVQAVVDDGTVLVLRARIALGRTACNWSQSS